MVGCSEKGSLVGTYVSIPLMLYGLFLLIRWMFQAKQRCHTSHIVGVTICVRVEGVGVLYLIDRLAMELCSGPHLDFGHRGRVSAYLFFVTFLKNPYILADMKGLAAFEGQ